MIEITPTMPLPYPPGVHLDGNNELWDSPQLAYLDGNLASNTFKLQSNSIVLKPRPITKPRPNAHRWRQGHWLDINVKLYIDGNKVFYTGFQVNYLNIGDGNLDLINCYGRQTEGTYKGAVLAWEKNGIAFYFDGVITGATEPIQALDCVPDNIYINHYLVQSADEPIEQYYPEKIFTHRTIQPHSQNVPWNELYRVARSSPNSTDYLHYFDLGPKLTMLGTPGVTFLGYWLDYWPSWNNIKYLFEYKGARYIWTVYTMEGAEEYNSEGLIMVCNREIKIDPSMIFCSWHPDFPATEFVYCPKELGGNGLPGPSSVGSIIVMKGHTEYMLKYHNEDYWYTLQYTGIGNDYKVLKAIYENRNVYSKIVVVNNTILIKGR